jgi:hypothetical protein
VDDSTGEIACLDKDPLMPELPVPEEPCWYGFDEELEAVNDDNGYYAVCL